VGKERALALPRLLSGRKTFYSLPPGDLPPLEEGRPEGKRKVFINYKDYNNA